MSVETKNRKETTKNSKTFSGEDATEVYSESDMTILADSFEMKFKSISIEHETSLL